jgi:hypothetical protein
MLPMGWGFGDLRGSGGVHIVCLLVSYESVVEGVWTDLLWVP